jgi:dethiobiotin synthetase
VAPVRFSAALAPNVAAEREGRQIDLEAIFTAYARICSRAEVVVVEAIGGLLCPISNDFWVVHLAAMMKLPVVIVARAGLGTINHTLLTIHAARTAALEVAGVVVNRSAGEARCADDELAMLTNPSQIEARGNVPVLAVVPEEAANSVAEGHIGIATQLAIDRVDWESITGLPARSPRRPGG